MVDRSLMGLAADRGVTICLADLDGADGLWVPEERTILVNRALPESRVNEVIEHELQHVAIDDQHAELDAGVFRPPPGPLQTLLGKRWATPALSAAAFVALVGGVTLGLAAALPDSPSQGITTPSPVRDGVLPSPSEPTTTVVPSVDAEGRTTYKTIVVSRPAGSPVATATPTGSPTAPATSRPLPPATPTRPATRTPTPTPTQTTDSPTATATTPAVTATPVDPTDVGQPTGGAGDDSVVTEPAGESLPGTGATS